MDDTAEKHSQDLDTHCKGVDLSMLKELKVTLMTIGEWTSNEVKLIMQIKESKLCEHPECMDAIEKDVYAPCDRSDLGACLRDCESVANQSVLHKENFS